MKLPSLRGDKADDEVSEYSGNTFCVDWEILCEDVDASNAGLQELEAAFDNDKDTDAEEGINWMKPILLKCDDETAKETCKKEEVELEEGEEKVEEEEEALVEGEEKVEDGEE